MIIDNEQTVSQMQVVGTCAVISESAIVYNDM